MIDTSFAKRLELDGASFLVRGLSVGEYCELFYSGFVSRRVKTSLFVKVALMCVVDWSDVPYTDRGEPVYDEEGAQMFVPYSPEMVENLDDEKLVKIGHYAWTEMTSVSEDEQEWLRGFIRFSDFMADDDHKAEAKYYSCDECVRVGKNLTKPCGRTELEINQIKKQLKEEGKIDATKTIEQSAKKEQRTKSLIDKMKTRRRATTMHNTKANQKVEKNTTKVVLKGHTYPECPVTWVPDWIRVLGDKMLFCEKHNMNFFSGGLAQQPKKLYDIARIVSGELSKIEKERMDKDFKKSNKNKK